MNKSKRKTITLFLTMCIAIVMLLSCIGIISSTGKKAEAIKETNLSSQSTNLGELLLNDTSGNVFNADRFWLLVKQISSGTVTNKNGLASLGATEMTSANFRAYNGRDVVVRIDGIPWTATYLSQNKKGEPILTLWQADVRAIDFFDFNYNRLEKGAINLASSVASAGSTSIPANLYGTSYIATSALNNGGNCLINNSGTLKTATQSADSTYAKFTMPSVTGSITKFIEIPNNVPYQNDNQKESAKMQSNYDYDLNNDALVAPIAANMYDIYHTYATYSSFDKEAYKAWGGHRIWLPSLAEVGYDSDSTKNGLWDTSTNQRTSTTSISGTKIDYQWLRSGGHHTVGVEFVLDAAGTSWDYLSCSATYSAIRPAFHLNLKAVADSLGIASPSDIDVDYNGEDWTSFDNVPTEKKKWYDSAKITLDFSADEVIDAGTYTVTATIKDEFASDGLEFKGSPTKPGEDAVTRIFNFTINKKKIGVNLTKQGGLPVVSLKNSSDVNVKDTLENGRAPELGFNYTGNGYNSTTLPTAVGQTYTATVKILNTDTCKNYELDKTYSTTFDVPKRKIAIPTRSGTYSEEYTGEDITFAMTEGDNEDITIELPDGMTRDGNTLTAKKVGTYTVTAKLKDDGEATQWENGTSDPIELEYKITAKPLTVTISCDDTDYSWYVGDTPTVTITEDSHANDNVVLYIYYVNDNSPSSKIDTIDSTSKTTTITMPGDLSNVYLPKGTYTIYVELKTTGTNDNANYSLTTKTQSFSVKKKDVTKPERTGSYSEGYTGKDINFTMTEGDNADIKIELPNGMTRVGNTLTAKKVGAYKVIAKLKDDGIATQWEDGTTGQVELQYDVTKKPLNVTITINATDSAWNRGDMPTVVITEDSYADDTVELYIYYIDNSIGESKKYESINSTKVVAGKTTTVTMPGSIAQGSYTLCVRMRDEDAADNTNYLFTGVKTQAFTVKGNSIDVDDTVINWNYNGIPIGNPTGTYSMVYTGVEYAFSIDDTVLAAHGAKIDLSKGINGYSGDVKATNAKSSTYSVTVYLKNYDDTYEDYAAQYTLTYQIDKAKYGLSVLSWPSVNDLEFTGSAQSVELQGTLPAGLTASYSGNGNTPVGDYATTVTFSVGSGYISNYYVPVAGDTSTYDGDFSFTYDWHIVKATLNVTWKDDNNASSDVYKLPILKSIGTLDVDSMVDYTYYDSDNNVVTTLPSETTSELTFKAVATLKTAFAGNYQFATGTNEYTFTIGKNKYVVKLVLKWDNKNIDGAQLPYKGDGYTPTIEITRADGGVVAADITLKYYEDSSSIAMAGAPVEVGRYRIEVTLKSNKADDNYIDDDSAEFSFEIVKADFDVSGLKWQYTHEGVTATYDSSQGKWVDSTGGEILPMTYDKSAHTLTLAGKDDITGLTITVSDNSKTDADSYTAQITFSYDTNSYNAPEFPTTLAWSIAKAKIDTSAVVWGYTIEDGEEIVFTDDLPYTRVDGAEVKYKVGLINLPEELIEAISYKGGQEQSKVDDYTIEYVIGDLGSNYEAVVMPSGLQKKLNWSIVTKYLPTPVYDKSWSVFDGEEHDFAQMFGITQEGWENYMTMTITKDGVAYAGLDGDAYKAIKAGEYTVVFDLVDYDNIDFEDGVWPAASTLVRVKAYEISVQWQGNNTNATVVMENWVKSYVAYRFKDGDGNILENGIKDMEADVTYYKELYAKDGYEEDIKIYGEPKTVLRPGSTATVEKPVFDSNKTITYDGNAHNIEEFLRGEIPTGVKLELAGGNLTDAGEYTVKVSLEDEEIYCWDDEEGGTASYTVTIKIEKAIITQNKLNWTTDEDGVPTLSVRGNSEITFTYTYYDEDGNELTVAEIADGLECAKVVAKLNNNNYAMLDASNKVVSEVTYLPKGEEPDDPSGEIPSGDNNPSGNTPGNGDGNNNGGSGSLDELIEQLKDKPIAQILTSIIAIILIIIFTSKGFGYLSKSKQEKKMAESKYKTYYAGAFLGIAAGGWTAIACILVVLAAAALVFMIMAKNKYNKSQVYAESLRGEYERNQKAEEKEEARKRDESMQMMFMGMMGNGAGGSGMSREEVCTIIADTVNALLPSVQQMLPQQAGMSEETIQKMLDQNDDKMQKMMAQNDERIEKLMDKIMELSANQGEVQIVEKVVEVPVEKIVEKEVIKEVPVEVEKEAAATVEPKAKKEIAPRLTLDEAYAKLSKQKQKYFDGVKEYALTKDKCKEKKSTYAITLGQSTVNPLVKLTIKKDNVVALFKMEDEFMKDLRRDASGDGTKLKVKETELVVADAQAFDTAKKMVDLREDQIERYQDLLKEQRATRNKK